MYEETDHIHWYTLGHAADKLVMTEVQALLYLQDKHVRYRQICIDNKSLVLVDAVATETLVRLFEEEAAASEEVTV